MNYGGRGLKRRRNTDKWDVTLTYKDPQTGEMVPTYHTVEATTRKKAEKARDELILELELKGPSVNTKQTLGEYLEDDLRYKEDARTVERTAVDKIEESFDINRTSISLITPRALSSSTQSGSNTNTERKNRGCGLRTFFSGRWGTTSPRQANGSTGNPNGRRSATTWSASTWACSQTAREPGAMMNTAAPALTSLPPSRRRLSTAIISHSLILLAAKTATN